MDDVAVRSFLYAPAHRARVVEKALRGETDAEAVIVDLEDGVPVDARAEAERTLRSCGDAGPEDPPALCRIRSGADARRADLALVASRFTGVLLAKAEEPEDVDDVADLIAERGTTLGIWLLVESARGVEQLPTLLTGPVRITGVMLGAGDLRADLGLLDDTDHRQLDAARSRTVFAAAAAGIRHIVDTPEAEIEPGEPFLASARSARGLGFTAKAAIHPGQLAAIHEVFRATADPRAWAHAVLDTADGAVRVGGSMVDEATRRLARRILAGRPRD